MRETEPEPALIAQLVLLVLSILPLAISVLIAVVSTTKALEPMAFWTWKAVEESVASWNNASPCAVKDLFEATVVLPLSVFVPEPLVKVPPPL